MFKVVSCSLPFALGITQGSVLGPTFYTVFRGDLKLYLVFIWYLITLMTLNSKADWCLTEWRIWSCTVLGPLPIRRSLTSPKQSETSFAALVLWLDVDLPNLHQTERIAEAKLRDIVPICVFVTLKIMLILFLKYVISDPTEFGNLGTKFCPAHS